jgi:hypothetical protein
MRQHVFIEAKSHYLLKEIPKRVAVQFEFSIGLKPVNSLVDNLEKLTQKRFSSSTPQHVHQLIHKHIHNSHRKPLDMQKELL